jgi:hypothetical protein
MNAVPPKVVLFPAPQWYPCICRAMIIGLNVYLLWATFAG